MSTSNEDLLTRLFPPVEKLLAVPVAKDGNGVVQLTCIVYARPGGGKTSTTRWLVAEGIKRYGTESVSACSARGDLELLLRGGFEPRPVNILVGEDLTNWKFSDWEKWAFFNVRHLMKEATGLDRGLCLIIMEVHDVHRIPKEFRMDVDAHIVCNSPTNEYDERFYVRKLGAGTVKWLHQLEDQWSQSPSLKRFKAFYTHSKQGKLEIPFVRENNIVQLKWKRPEEREIEPAQTSSSKGLLRLLGWSFVLFFLLLGLAVALGI